MSGALHASDLDRIDSQLAETDALLEKVYPGDAGTRQPIHTVYVSGETYTPQLTANWGAQALTAVESAGGMEALAARVGIDESIAALVASRTVAKLQREPIEDLRLDFEDGYGDRGEAEDADATNAAAHVAAGVAAGQAPPFIGIRFKSFEKATRARALRTLDLFIGGLMGPGGLPDGLVLTLPKVSTTAQVAAMVDVAATLERAYGLPEGRITFEVQVETPQLILGADGRSPLAQLPTVAPGRITGLHFGTYDYSAALGISAQYQSMEHPVADLAKEIMQLSAAGRGIRISDGSTNILPIGDRAEESWSLHARLVRRSLERGIYQGWDMHPGHLATRYLATYAFYREGYEAAAARLHTYLNKTPGAVMDEPATARALAWFVLRGVQCGAISDDEVTRDIGVTDKQLTALAHPRLEADKAWRARAATKNS